MSPDGPEDSGSTSRNAPSAPSVAFVAPSSTGESTGKSSGEPPARPAKATKATTSPPATKATKATTSPPATKAAKAPKAAKATKAAKAAKAPKAAKATKAAPAGEPGTPATATTARRSTKSTQSTAGAEATEVIQVAAATKAAKARKIAKVAATSSPADGDADQRVESAPATGRRATKATKSATKAPKSATKTAKSATRAAPAEAADTAAVADPAQVTGAPDEPAKRPAVPLFAAPPPPRGATSTAPADEPADTGGTGTTAAIPAADGTGTAATDGTGEAPDGESGSTRRRRRGRRGGRGRGRTSETDSAGTDDHDATAADSSDAGAPDRPEATAGARSDTADAADAADSAADSGDDDSDAGAGTSRRRRRHRRRGEDGEAAEVNRRPDRRDDKRDDKRDDEVRSISGSTRLEAKRQRRRDGRDQGRRRPPILSESEFLARRESVDRVMVVRQRGDRTQIGVLEDDILVEHYVTRASSSSYAGNVYLGRVQNVLPSMEAAFIDIGKGRNAVLYAGEVDWSLAGLVGHSRSIEQAMKSGDAVLVQVTKDPMGHKGARLTSQISLPGRFLVYVPGAGATGISRKLPDTERSRLKAILRDIVPEDAGVIIRTAAEGASEEELTRDVARLKAQWEVISNRVEKDRAKAPVLLHEEPDLAIRVVRDLFNEDFASMIVSGDDAWEMIEQYVQHVAPELGARVHHHTAESDVFADRRIDEQLTKALDRKVWLPSGGTLVIDRTEAMTVIDVNTGKFIGRVGKAGKAGKAGLGGSGGNLEETVTRNNLEAAEEIVRQLRLRDVGGMVVVDFIDMVLQDNRDLVLRRLTECLGRDRTRHQVAEVTSLGLVQLTRKRVGQGLLEAFSEPCETCNGRGVIVRSEPVDTLPQHGGTGGEGRRRAKRANGGSGSRRQERVDGFEHVASAITAVTDPPTAEQVPRPELVAVGASAAATADPQDTASGSSAAPTQPPSQRPRHRRRAASRPAGPPSGSEG